MRWRDNVNSVYSFIEKRTNLANVSLVIIIQTIFQLILSFYISPELLKITGERMLDLRIFYDAQNLEMYVAKLGEAGRKTYMYGIIIDMIYALAYTVSFLLMGVFLGQKAGLTAEIIKILLLMPLLLMISDIIENTGNLIILAQYPTKGNLMNLQGYFTLAKQLLLTWNILVIGGIGLLALKRQLASINR